MDINYANKASRLKIRGVMLKLFSRPLISFTCDQLQDLDQNFLVDKVKEP